MKWPMVTGPLYGANIGRGKAKGRIETKLDMSFFCNLRPISAAYVTPAWLAASILKRFIASRAFGLTRLLLDLPDILCISLIILFC